MAPEYFKRVLRPYEAEHYLDGVDKRRHDGWEQARLIVSPYRSENSEPIVFPWEDKKAVEPTNEELNELYDWSNNVLKAIEDGRRSSEAKD